MIIFKFKLEDFSCHNFTATENVKKILKKDKNNNYYCVLMSGFWWFSNIDPTLIKKYCIIAATIPEISKHLIQT